MGTQKSSDGSVVIDAGDLRKYRTEIPNMVDDMGLSVYAFRLYAHLKRVAGQDGVCYQGKRKIAEVCNMSAGMVTKAKRELVDAGLIVIDAGNAAERRPDHITIVDIWRKNFETFSFSDTSHTVTTSGHDVTRAGHTVNGAGHVVVHKNKPIKKEPKEEAARPPAQTDTELPEAYWLYERVFAYPAFNPGWNQDKRMEVINQLENISNRYDKQTILEAFENVAQRDLENQINGKGKIQNKLAYALRILQEDAKPKSKRVRAMVTTQDPWTNEIEQSIVEMTLEQAQRQNLEIMEYA